MITASCEGDYGDGALACAVLSRIPDGPHDFILKRSTVTKMRTPADVARWHALTAPLFLKQPYIREYRVAKPGEYADWHSGEFRAKGLHSVSQTLFQSHLNWLIQAKGIGQDYKSDKPWLTVDPSPKTKDRVVIARSERYRNPYFNWKAVVDKYGDKILFIGLPHEHQEFCASYGAVEHLPTKDYLEVAEAIKGSLLFIGNQSSPMAVAEGLKHHSIQETCLFIVDCVYKRDNAQYVSNGKMTLPGFWGQEDTQVPPFKITPEDPPTHTAPPGQWQYQGMKSYFIGGLLKFAQREHPDLTPAQVKHLVLQENVLRVPEFFLDNGDMQGFRKVEKALQNAGYPPRTFKEIIGLS